MKKEKTDKSLRFFGIPKMMYLVKRFRKEVAS